ncbi:MAG TPA: tripartite tricarboxylate transporter substrate binding protein [Usitatibacter sp.]|jgi:tripartite-type tricarboxylate transporter receptor subunit TctC|nr:tripartite tricarboxylate transporter substrate binding protein [Usitatibacter sp.]
MIPKIAAALAGALALAAAVPTAAQTYPSKPVTIVVPFTPGGSSDITARTVAAKLQESLGQSFVIDNKPGANGSLGGKFVAAAAPDGYTLFVGSIGVFAINPVLYKDLGYHPLKDYELLSVAVRTPNALVTRANFPAGNMQEFVEYVRKNPGKVSFASSGTGSSDHLTAALFWQKTGTSGIHVPYKGGSAAHLDIIAGNVDVSFQNLGSITQHVKAGKMKLLAVTGDKRDPAAPDTPTLAEAGVPGIEVYSWQAFVAPKGLPQNVKDRLQPALVAAIRHPDVVKRFTELGFEVVGNSPADFNRFLNDELARWKQVVDAGGIKQSD